MKSMYKLVLLLFLLAFGLSAEPGHSQIVGATVTGTVHDSSGAALNGATVSVRQSETGLTRKVTTDAEGRFFAPSVPIGPYGIGRPDYSSNVG